MVPFQQLLEPMRRALGTPAAPSSFQLESHDHELHGRRSSPHRIPSFDSNNHVWRQKNAADWRGESYGRRYYRHAVSHQFNRLDCSYFRQHSASLVLNINNADPNRVKGELEGYLWQVETECAFRNPSFTVTWTTNSLLK